MWKKKPSGCDNRKKAKESAQKNASVIAKTPKLLNYFTKQGATKVTSILIYKLLLTLFFFCYNPHRTSNYITNRLIDPAFVILNFMMHIDECELLNTKNNVDDSPSVPILYSML
jgi:hypothetical protein